MVHRNQSARAMVNATDESRTATTSFEPNLKQALLNTGQFNEQGPGTYLGFPEYGTKLQISKRLIKVNPKRSVLLTFIQSGACLHPDVFPYVPLAYLHLHVITLIL